MQKKCKAYDSFYITILIIIFYFTEISTISTLAVLSLLLQFP